MQKLYSFGSFSKGLKHVVSVICLIQIPLISSAQITENTIIKKKKIYHITESAFDNIDLNQKNLVIFGDANLRNIDPNFCISVFKHFHRKGVRLLVVNLPVCHERNFNEFIKTGNNDYLEGYGSAFRDFFYLLHDFYQDLPPNEKFRILAVDYGCFISNYINSLFDLLPVDKEIPSEIIPVIDSITKYNDKGTMKNPYNLDENGYELLHSSINEGFEENRKIFSKYLGENAELFGRIIEGNNCNILSVKNRNCHKATRNKYIVSNLESEFETLNNSAIGIYFNFNDISKEYLTSNIQQPDSGNLVLQLQRQNNSNIKNVYTIKIAVKNSEYFDYAEMEKSNTHETTVKKRNKGAATLFLTDKSSDFVVFIPESFLVRKKRSKIQRFR